MGGRAARAPVAMTARRKWRRLPSDLDHVRREEAAVAEEDVDAGLAGPLEAVDDADPGAQPAHARHGEAEVGGRVRGHGGAAEAPGALAGVGPGARGADHPLGGDAADVQAVAAHQVALDQGDLGAEPGGPLGRDQTGGAGADHHQVVARGGLGVDPGVRMDVGEELAVELVQRLDGEVDGRGHFLAPVCLPRRARRSAGAAPCRPGG